MDSDTLRKMQIEHGKATLSLRDEAARQLQQALATGKPKEIAQATSRLKKLEKLIKMYGLEQYASISDQS